MSSHRVVLFFVALALLLACGRAADDYHQMKSGYRFKNGPVLYETRLNGDSVPFTVDSFVVVDTLPELGRYIIGFNRQRLPPMPVPDFQSGGVHVLDPAKTMHYGAADFDGNIIIFPQFLVWNYLGDGYVAVAHHINDDACGLLHLRGELVTDMTYRELKYDSASGKILGLHFRVNNWVYDTLNVPLTENH